VRLAGAQQPLQCLEHMPIAQIPAFARAAVHDAVILFGGAHDARVLRRVEERVAVLMQIVEAMREQLVQLLDRLILAWVLLAVRDGPAISGRLILPRSQAAIALARAPGRRGIDLVEIAQYRLDRGTEAVNVEPAKGGATLGRQALIVQPQPIDKRQYLLVAPNP